MIHFCKKKSSKKTWFS